MHDHLIYTGTQIFLQFRKKLFKKVAVNFIFGIFMTSFLTDLAFLTYK